MAEIADSIHITCTTYITGVAYITDSIQIISTTYIAVVADITGNTDITDIADITLSILHNRWIYLYIARHISFTTGCI